MAAVPGLSAVVPLMHALYGPTGIIVLPDGSRLFHGVADRGDFEEGLPQGSPESSAAFCVLIDEAVRRLHATLEGAGGGAWFIMDDGYAAGSAELVLPALEQFARDCLELGLHMQFGKCSFFSATPPEQQVSAELERLGIQPGGLEARGAEAEAAPGVVPARPFTCGITVGGIPLGNADFIQTTLDQKAADFESYVTSTISQLQSASSFGLWSCLYSAISTRLDYWLQHLPPDVTQGLCTAADRVLGEAVERLTYAGALDDDVTLRRMRLPVRRRGCGIRSRADVSRAAYCASLRRALQALIDVTSVDGDVAPGFFPQLEGLVGRGAFDFDRPAHRLRVFMGAPTVHAGYFAEAWEYMQEEVAGAVDIASGPFAADAESVPLVAQLQHRLTDAREAAAARRLDAMVLALPQEDPRRCSWLEAADGARIAGRWLSGHPSTAHGMVCSSAEFCEMLASYLGVESPAARAPGLVGLEFTASVGGGGRRSQEACGGRRWLDGGVRSAPW